MKISSNRICKRIKIVCLFHPGKLHSFKNSSYNQTMIIGVGICTYFIALGHGFPSQQYRVHWLSSGVHIILIFTSFLGTSRSNQTVRKLYFNFCCLNPSCRTGFWNFWNISFSGKFKFRDLQKLNKLDIHSGKEWKRNCIYFGFIQV